jgi:hypothetical protein
MGLHYDELSLGFELTPDILKHKNKALLRVEIIEEYTPKVFRPIIPDRIRSPEQYDGVFLRSIPGSVNLGVEFDSISHGHHVFRLLIMIPGIIRLLSQKYWRDHTEKKRKNDPKTDHLACSSTHNTSLGDLFVSFHRATHNTESNGGQFDNG